MSRALPTTAVPINGHALRELRIRTGVSVADLAAGADIDRSYLTKIERGQKKRVSPGVYNRLITCLGIQDRRALLGDVTAETV